MTDRKNQNSILILATIGVYFGLVLVGATPQVLAQTTRASKVEPTGELAERRGCMDIQLSCRGLLADVREQETKYLWFNDHSIREYVTLLEEVLRTYPEKEEDRLDITWLSADQSRPFRSLETSSPSSFPFLSRVSTKKRERLEEDILFTGNGSPGKRFSLTIQRDRGQTISFFKVVNPGIDPHLLKTAYGSALDLYRCDYGFELENVILKNTEITLEDDNLVVVTRLPRGSLDSLLAKDAK
ncbi:MAG: hypothetical protein ABI999_18120 [Acidobacteriota bacterium]